MERTRLAAAERMGMGDCSKSVMPKFAVLAPAKDGGSIAARYFMPWQTHPTMAVTGSQCIASCALTPGTIADGLLDRPKDAPAQVILEHPMGKMEVIVDYDITDGQFIHKSAGLVRTCRKLAAGEVFVPSSVWKRDTNT